MSRPEDRLCRSSRGRLIKQEPVRRSRRAGRGCHVQSTVQWASATLRWLLRLLVRAKRRKNSRCNLYPDLSGVDHSRNTRAPCQCHSDARRSRCPRPCWVYDRCAQVGALLAAVGRGPSTGNLLSQVVTNRHLATESDASPLEPHLWLYLIALIIAIGTWRGARRPASKRQLVNWNLRNWLGPSEADDSAQIDRRRTVDIPAALCRTYGIADPDPPSKAPGWHAHPRPGILDDGRPQRIEKWNRLAAGPEALRIEHRRGRAENRRNDLPDRGNGSGVDHPPLDTDEFRTDEHAALRSKR
jgi:hypothetical protein